MTTPTRTLRTAPLEHREDAREARPVQPAKARGAQPQVERARV